jgi:hypothetical protein
MKRHGEFAVRCGVCSAWLPIDPETHLRFILADPVECTQ